MKKLVISSMSKSAGKTSLVVGLARSIGKSFGYIKPFGDRSMYSKKRLWDYDSALIVDIFDLDQEHTSIGFDHSKLGYMYDEEGTKKKLDEMVETAGKDKDVLFIECGKDLCYGASVKLDALSIARYTKGDLVVVVGGDNAAILDDIAFLKKYVSLEDVNFKGVIINGVDDIEDFKDHYLEMIEELEVPILGIVPFEKDLTYPSVNYLAESLFAKVLAGQKGMSKLVKHIFVGATASDAAVLQPMFKKPGKMFITGGDRTDLILSALEGDTAAIVLTNNMLPSAQIIAKAEDSDVPLLLVPIDTYEAAKRIEQIQPLLTKHESDKVDLITALIKENVDIEKLV